MLTATYMETVSVTNGGMEKLIALYTMDNALRNVLAALAHSTQIVTPVKQMHHSTEMHVYAMKDGPDLTAKTGKENAHANALAAMQRTIVKVVV